ncbi:MAG: glycoside hydrolase family 172 protein [Planctomycetota bacterium]|jgi:hypothetical protein
MKNLQTIANAAAVLIALLTGTIVFVGCTANSDYQSYVDAPYIVDVPIESRSIAFENPTGAKGQAAKAASNLGVGRKGAPAKSIKPGETVTLCNIKGPGVIRHIWMTTHRRPDSLLGMVIRAYWDNQKHPSIEAPIGNFFGISHGGEPRQAYQSAVHSVNPNAGMNIWLPMPFSKQARFTITNHSDKETVLFYNIDYTLADRLTEPFGRLHILYRRENPTTLKKDFVILPKRTGMGRFVGCVLGIRPLSGDWWGEGEIKVYLDGDKQFPTIAGTGTEDYIGQSWGLQDKTYLYGGTSLNSKGLISIYRWHIKDPIYWKKDVRVTIQQIGWKGGLYERQDDWSTTTFWYEPLPAAPLPPLPDYKTRIADYKTAANP